MSDILRVLCIVGLGAIGIGALTCLVFLAAWVMEEW